MPAVASSMVTLDWCYDETEDEVRIYVNGTSVSSRNVSGSTSYSSRNGLKLIFSLLEEYRFYSNQIALVSSETLFIKNLVIGLFQLILA